MTEDTLRMARKAGRARGAVVEVRFTDGTAARMRAWLGAGIRYRDQGAGDLGARMLRAFRERLAGEGSRAVIIGTDCPSLDAATIASAFAALEDHDLVVGPALDGGYYLVGLQAPQPVLFRDMPWGTARVLSETLERAAAAGLSVARLQPLADVDRPEDLAPLP
jgi:rSAM/selenodomain-associated transferase 1